jgi:hypothetical protein
VAETSGVLDLSTPSRIHVVWVGGKAMSAIAEILVAMGHTVSGSDPNDVPILARLRDLGVSVAVGDRTALPEGVATVVRSSGTADDHPEVVEARRRGIPVLGRPAVQGAIARTRRTSECSETPIVCRFPGRVCEIMLIVAGSEIAVHEIKKIDPMMTACQTGKTMTTRNPNMASRLKTIRARLYPNRSLRYPPGNEYRALSRLSIPFSSPTDRAPPPNATR